MASKLIDIHNMIKRNASVLSDSSPICKDQHSSNGETNSISSLSPSSSSHSASSTDQYEYPRGYFEALINNAKARYDEALKFYHMKRTYSAKFGFYITLLQDIFIELASPPPTLPSDTYRKLAKLRQDIRWLQLNLESRRDLLSTIPTSTLDLSSARSEIGEGDKSEAEHHEDSVYEQEAARAKLGRLRQMEMAQLLQTITDLSLQELQIRQRRLEAEAEYRRQFNENPPTPVAALALKLPANAVPESVTSTIKSPDSESPSEADEFENLHPSIYTINFRPPNRCVFCLRFHWSHLCLEIPTLEGRHRFYRIYQLCFLCGKAHRGMCHPFDRYCKWPQCAAKNDHHTAVCPNVTYPITKEITAAYIECLKELKKRYNADTVSRPAKLSRAKFGREDYWYSSSRRASKRSNRHY